MNKSNYGYYGVDVNYTPLMHKKTVTMSGIMILKRMSCNHFPDAIATVGFAFLFSQIIIT